MSIYLGSSEPSKIYVGSSEVKSVYVGTTKVRPQYLYKFEYDFSNKSVSQIKTDGFSFIYLNGSTTPTPTSDGIYCQSGLGSIAVLMKREGISTALKSSNKVTLKFTGKTTEGQISLILYKILNSSQQTNPTGGYIQLASNNKAVYWFIYGNISNQSINYNTYYNVMVTQTCVLDFVNKTMTITDTLGFSKVLTLTDTQISNIKNNITAYSAQIGTGATMKSISIIIE